MKMLVKMSAALAVGALAAPVAPDRAFTSDPQSPAKRRAPSHPVSLEPGPIRSMVAYEEFSVGRYSGRMRSSRRTAVGAERASTHSPFADP
jgi:hypothetical protein